MTSMYSKVVLFFLYLNLKVHGEPDADAHGHGHGEYQCFNVEAQE